MGKALTLSKIEKMFPDEGTCLEHVFRARYGATHACAKCSKIAKYHRVKKRRSYECERCGHQVYPTAGTPFDRTRTPLTVWFKVMTMFCASRNGVSAKEIQRITGVTYKTAWRMGHEIRKYMADVDGDAPLGGSDDGSPIVEADKAFLGGKDKSGKDDKSVVLGMAERGGDVIARVIPGRGAHDIIPVVNQFVKRGSKIATDEWRAFREVTILGMHHAAVNHSKKEWVRGPVHTNTIEAFWGNLKRGISGTYVWVSKKHLQKCLCEFEFRHNLRKTPEMMMVSLLRAFPKPVDRRGSSGQEGG